MEFGKTPDSKLKLNGSSGQVTFAWHLDKVTDSHGNYMLYLYNNNSSTNEISIKEIQYTGNNDPSLNIAPYNSVKFYYDIRPDKRDGYMLGNHLQRTLILREIEVDCEGNFTKGYKFNYGYDSQDPYHPQTLDRKSTRLNSSHIQKSRMPSSA